MSDIVGAFRGYALDKDNCPRMDTEVVYVRVGLLMEAAARIEQLEAALRPLACTCEVKQVAYCSRSEVDCPFWNARAALGKNCT